LVDVTAKMIIYEAFIEGSLEAPKHLARRVHDLYFEPNTRSFGCERSGVFPTRSHPHSRSSIPSHNSRPQRNWDHSWKLAFHGRSKTGSTIRCAKLFKWVSDDHSRESRYPVIG
jgi:hypothetical protein